MTNKTPHEVIAEGVATFEKDFRDYLDASIAYAEVQEPYQPLSSEDEIKWLKNWLTQYSQKLVEVTRESERERLMPWLECSRDCINNRFEAGEPTNDGGYRVKVAGKWYQTRPVDESPKCDCGLAKTLTKDTPAED